MHKIIAYTVIVFLTMLPVYCLAQQQEDKPRFRILTYGLPNFERQNAENVISEKWGIEFYRVAGCIVSKCLVARVKKHNKKVYSLIVNKYGKDWSDRFYDEVDAEFKTENKVELLVRRYDSVNPGKITVAPEKHLYITMKPVPNSTKYIVLYQGFGNWEGKEEWLTYCKLQVDYKTGSVIVLSNKIVKE